MQQRSRGQNGPAGIEHCPTGIQGLDDITRGGLPRGRPTLVCGGAGSGKTLLAAEFLVRGAMEYGEPGVFMTFEETADEFAANVASLGFDIDGLRRAGQLAVDWIYTERSQFDETGEYDLDGLFLRLDYAVNAVGAKRIALDSLESLFVALEDTTILRAELRRLFRWLKERELTAVVTAEQGEGTLTRYGFEEYVSDCVIFLNHRVADDVATRRLRVVKYRGSEHGTNEYPFLIDSGGLTVVPVTSFVLQHKASTERVSTGVEDLDEMLGGGYFRATSVMISGAAGTGKTSLAAAFVDGACRRGERCLYFLFEEAEAQIIRNMRSIGLKLATHARNGTLTFEAARPTAAGLEAHLARIYSRVREVDPAIVVLDPLTSLEPLAVQSEVRAMLMRTLDYLKSNGITTLATSVTGGDPDQETNVSSLIDTWVQLRNVETAGERNRALYVLKSRGMAHSNLVRELVLSSKGISLVEPYRGPHGFVVGSARRILQAEDEAAGIVRDHGATRAGQRRRRTKD